MDVPFNLRKSKYPVALLPKIKHSVITSLLLALRFPVIQMELTSLQV